MSNWSYDFLTLSLNLDSWYKYRQKNMKGTVRKNKISELWSNFTNFLFLYYDATTVSVIYPAMKIIFTLFMSYDMWGLSYLSIFNLKT